MRLFDEGEPADSSDLRHVLSEMAGVPKAYILLVEALLFDDQGQSTPENQPRSSAEQAGKLKAIRGPVLGEESFRYALNRLLAQRFGPNASVTILRFLAVCWDTVPPDQSPTGQEQHRIVVSYLCDASPKTPGP